MPQKSTIPKRRAVAPAYEVAQKKLVGVFFPPIWKGLYREPVLVCRSMQHGSKLSIRAVGRDVETPEVYRVRTAKGVATVRALPTAFPTYSGMDTSPEGFELSIVAPRKMPTRIEIGNDDLPMPLDFVSVDGRRILLSNKQTKFFNFSLGGGQHEIKIAWQPAE